MTVIARFNDLNNRDSSRKEIKSLLVDAKTENNAEIVFRLSKVLNTFPEKEVFRLTIREYKDAGLNGAQHTGDYKEALDGCGRLKKGYKFHYGKIVKVEPKKPVATIKTNKNAQSTTKPNIENPKIATQNKKVAAKTARSKTPVKVKQEVEKVASSKVKPVTPTLDLSIFKNIVSKDINFRSNLTGIYFDNGTAVATNAHILAIANFKHSKSQQGKILNLFDKKNPNKYIDAKFPQYKEVIPKYENFTDFIDLQTIVNDAKTNLKMVGKYGFIALSDKEIEYYDAKHYYDIFKFLLDSGATKIKYAFSKGKVMFINADNKSLGFLMPRTYNKGILSGYFSYSKKGYNENFKGHGLSGSDLFDKTKKSTTKVKNTIRKTIVKRIVNTRNVSKPISENVNRQSLAYKMAHKPVVASYFTVANKQISDFLGNVERKTKESVFISLTGGQGSMKTRMAFQFMNALAQNYKVGHASIEEHPESVLYFDKAKEYLNEKALHNIENPEIKTVQDLHLLVENNDVIVIDSYTKMQEMVKGFEVDKDLRKKYNGKLFLVIFQQTTDGKMRGGSKSQFDADIVLFTKKESDYRDNYVYTDKNRYQKKPLDSLHFNIFSGKLVAENTTEANPEQIETALNQINKLLSFEVN